jgi:glycosyltransferase involved in cell wall biosynthesis
MGDKMSGDSRDNKQTFEDLLLAGFNSWRYALIEPVRLRLARLKHAHKYEALNQKPLISVCVPTYNRGSILIERAVATVLAQTYTNFELIIVGDHCTDNTEELLSKIKDPRLKFFNLPSRKRKYKQRLENHWFVGGAIPANKAMELSSGEWIARVDDDDTWTPDHLEKLLEFAEKGRYEFVSGLYIEERFDHQKVIDGIRANDPYYTQKPALLNDTSPKIGGVNSWFYRSYLKFMPYNPDCWRKSWNRVWDVDLSQRIYGAGVNMGFLEEVVAFVLPRPGEESVGLEAYKLTKEAKMEQYKFSE